VIDSFVLNALVCNSIYVDVALKRGDSMDNIRTTLLEQDGFEEKRLDDYIKFSPLICAAARRIRPLEDPFDRLGIYNDLELSILPRYMEIILQEMLDGDYFVG